MKSRIGNGNIEGFGKSCFICALLATMSFGIETANANLITNGSFEDTTNFYPLNHPDQDTKSLAKGSLALVDWTVINQELAWVGSNNYYDIHAQDGAFSLDLTGYHHTCVYGGVEQSIATQVGDHYELSYYLGGTHGKTGITASAGLTVRTSFHLFQATGWAYEFLNFTATSTSTLITLVGAEACSDGKYLGLDNVSVTQANPSVPEPSSGALLGFGLIGLALGVHRRRRMAIAAA